MKKLGLFSIVTLLFSSSMSAQSDTPPPSFYVGLGTGINANTAMLGARAGFRIHKTILLDAFTGMGTWGVKFGGGFVFNAKNKNAFCPAISIVQATGGELEYESQKNTAGDVKTMINLKPATMLNVGIQRQWVFREKNRLVLELGYSILLKGAEYEFTTTNFTPTTQDKNIWNLMKPTGVSLGLSFNFAL